MQSCVGQGFNLVMTKPLVQQQMNVQQLWQWPVARAGSPYVAAVALAAAAAVAAAGTEAETDSISSSDTTNRGNSSSSESSSSSGRSKGSGSSINGSNSINSCTAAADSLLMKYAGSPSKLKLPALSK